jgi:hypothetical protein
MADTTHLEEQIDRLVYKLYDLTDDEIKIVGATDPSPLQNDHLL